MASKLKGFDPKQFFVNHGEKLALGLVGLLVLYALGTANWVPFRGNPREIIEKAENARTNYDAKVATPEEIESLNLIVKADDQPSALVDRQILNDWSAGKYDLRVIMAVSPLDKDEPYKEAPFNQHPIKNLIASSSIVLLNLGPEAPPAAPTPGPESTPMPPALAQGGATAAANPNAALEDRFARRQDTVAAGPGGEMAGGEYYSPELAYYDPAASGEGYGGMSYAGTKLKGRGQPFVAVRGMIPLHELLRDVMEARHCDPQEAAQHFQLIDYVLERQTRDVFGQWPADDEGWEVVDRSTAEGIFKEVDGFDLDPVPPGLTDPAVTMPLPPRITGVWKTLATHPDIQNFSLSEAEMENEFRYQLALLQKAQEQQAQQRAAAPQEHTGPKKRGWADLVHDTRQITGELLGSGDMAYYGDINQDYYANQTSEGLYSTSADITNNQNFQKLVDELSKSGGKDAGKVDKALRDYIQKRISAVGNVLLFRFLDFAVEPGQTYRYRARLELENPTFGERVTDAVDPSVVEGETRFNGWSNITDPVTVEKSTYYFVHKVEANRNHVLLDFFHFDPALGTIVSNTEPDDRDDQSSFDRVPHLEVGFGQLIGGSLPVWELSPGALTFEKDDIDGTKQKDNDRGDTDPAGYAFETGDLLVTALEDPKLNRTEHPDLNIPRVQNYDLQLVQAVFIQKKDGRFDMLDTITQAPMREFQAYLLKLQNEPFKDLKKGGSLLAAGAEYMGTPYDVGSGGEYEMNIDGGARRNSSRLRSALRKSTSRADAAVRDATSRTGTSARGRPPAP